MDLLYSPQNIEKSYGDFSRKIEPQLFESSASTRSIHFPLPDRGPLNEQVCPLLHI